MNIYLKAILKRYYRLLYLFNSESYKQKYPLFLRKIGVDISADYYATGHGFIAPNVMFDANDYSLISIGDATTISTDVILLTHDYSISKGLKTIDSQLSGRFLKPIKIGSNSFIGMRSILLPGTELGNNVIVGAGSVVKGKFPDNVVIAGNPAKVICDVEKWAKSHYQAHDYEKL